MAQTILFGELHYTSITGPRFFGKVKIIVVFERISVNMSINMFYLAVSQEIYVGV
jgi:hypothetical protein